MRIAAVALAATAMLWVSGCGWTGSTPAPERGGVEQDQGEVRLPINEGGDAPGAQQQARVDIDAEAGCVFLRGGGRGEARAAFWPQGFRVQGERIVDREGSLVARDGDTIDFGGGLLPMTETIGSARPQCATDRVYIVGEVDR